MRAAVLSFACRMVLGGIFLVSGLAKIADPVRFVFTLREFRLFPEVVVAWSAIVLPWLEFLLGLLLLVGLLWRTSSFLLCILNFVFMFAILSVVVRGIEVDCGCFGMLADFLKLPDLADLKAVFRNAIFIGMNVYLLKADKTVLALENYLNEDVA